MEAQFVHDWVLFLLWLVPLAGVWWIALVRHQRRAMEHFVSATMQPRLIPRQSPWRFALQLACFLLGAALLLVAAARPQWGRSEQIVYERGRSLMIALDVSRSMLAADVHPNRLDRAKADLEDLISELRGDRAGLITFRNRAVLLCPMTTDHAFLRQSLDGAWIDSAPRGPTDVAAAIREALRALESDEGGHRAIILVSDGDDLAGRAEAAARVAGERGIPIFTVGIGDKRGARIPLGGSDGGFVRYQGEDVVTALNNDTLLAIAQASGGSYIPLETAGTGRTTLGELYHRHLRNIAERELQERREARYVERYQLFLIPGLMLLSIAALFSRGRLARSARRKSRHTGHTAATPPSTATLKDFNPPPRPVRLMAIGLLLLGPVLTLRGESNTVAVADALAEEPATAAAATVPGDADASSQTLARTAQRFYRLGQYADAAALFDLAANHAEGGPRDAYRFNAALARLKAGDHQEAADGFRGLTLQPDAPADAADGLGLALYRAARETPQTNLTAKASLMQASASAFQESLRMQPESAERRANLASVARDLPMLHEEAHIAEVMKEHGETPPEALLSRLLTQQRALLVETEQALTNATPAQITQLEALATRQKGAADLWIPLKQHVMAQAQSSTNAQAMAQMARQIELTREAMQTAARQLEDLQPEAVNTMAGGQESVYGLWLAVAPPPAVLDEDILRQSNVLHRTHDTLAATPAREQAEAHLLTRLFADRFPAWADQMAAQQQLPGTDAAPTGQSPTNSMALSAQDRQEIDLLTREVLSLQQQLTDVEDLTAAPARRVEAEALEKLLRIRELLPKPPPQDSNRQQQEKQEDPQKPQPDEQQEPQQQPPDESEQEQPPPDKPQELPDNLNELLQRALQREREHEQEKRRRQQSAPMRANEQDW